MRIQNKLIYNKLKNAMGYWGRMYVFEASKCLIEATNTDCLMNRLFSPNNNPNSILLALFDESRVYLQVCVVRGDLNNPSIRINYNKRRKK